MKRLFVLLLLQVPFAISILFAQQENSYDPWIWVSEPPEDCPFEPSTEIAGVALTENYRHYRQANGAYFVQDKPNFIFRVPFKEIANHTASNIFELNPDIIESPAIVHAFGMFTTKASLLVLSEDEIIHTIYKKNVKYVLWDDTTGGLSWFNDNPAFRPYGFIRDGKLNFHIYSVDNNLLSKMVNKINAIEHRNATKTI